jgi:3-hydroxyisobutyrate dehydrogenase
MIRQNGMYTNMAKYYDLIMTEGYYDYSGIVDGLVESLPEKEHQTPLRIMEIGCGTGLIMKEISTRTSTCSRIGSVRGFDLTSEMISLAKENLLGTFMDVWEQDVCQLCLYNDCDLMFSYGGVWYFVIDGDKEPVMISHITSLDAVKKGLENINRAIATDGILLLGIQGPHSDYAKPLNSYSHLIYSQKLSQLDNGFVKDYFLTDVSQSEPKQLMHETINYRMFKFDEAKKMLSNCGLEFCSIEKKFLKFKKVSATANAGPRILFIGTGNMGNPMALNLIVAGLPIMVHDLDRSKCENLIKRGAKWAETIASAFKEFRPEIVITSLPGPMQIRKVFLGNGGILESIIATYGQGDSIQLIDTSTNEIDLVHELAIKCKSTRTSSIRINYLEAPITNAADGAARGELSIFCGGDESCFKAMRPLLSVLGNKIFYLGDHGTGNAVKLITNLLWFVGAASIGEALILGSKSGIRLDILRDAIQASAGNSWVVEHDIPSIYAGHYDPSFTLDLCVKDLTLIDKLAGRHQVPLAMTGMAKFLFERALAKYGGAAAELYVVKLLEDQIGHSLHASSIGKGITAAAPPPFQSQS